MFDLCIDGFEIKFFEFFGMSGNIELKGCARIGVMGLRLDDNEYRIQGFTDISEEVNHENWRSSK